MSTANQSLEAWPDRTNRAYEFGPFHLDTDRQLLLKELQPIALTPKSYDTLLVLVESGGRLLSKEELMTFFNTMPDSFAQPCPDDGTLPHSDKKGWPTVRRLNIGLWER